MELVWLAVMATTVHMAQGMCHPDVMNGDVMNGDVMNGDVRVRGIDTEEFKAGRIEICDGDNWRAVCHAGWDGQAAMVVCRQLFPEVGYAALICGNSCLGERAGRGVTGFSCTGSEGTLLSCRGSAREDSCTHHAGVMCCMSCHGDANITPVHWTRCTAAGRDRTTCPIIPMAGERTCPPPVTPAPPTCATCNDVPVIKPPPDLATPTTSEESNNCTCAARADTDTSRGLTTGMMTETTPTTVAETTPTIATETTPTIVTETTPTIVTETSPTTVVDTTPTTVAETTPTTVAEITPTTVADTTPTTVAETTPTTVAETTPTTVAETTPTTVTETNAKGSRAANSVRESCPSLAALGGGLGALSAILTILLVGVVIGWVWSCRRRTGKSELQESSLTSTPLTNPSYTATSLSTNTPSVQYSSLGPRGTPLNHTPSAAQPISLAIYDVVNEKVVTGTKAPLSQPQEKRIYHEAGGGEGIYHVLEGPQVETQLKEGRGTGGREVGDTEELEGGDYHLLGEAGGGEGIYHVLEGPQEETQPKEGRGTGGRDTDELEGGDYHLLGEAGGGEGLVYEVPISISPAPAQPAAQPVGEPMDTEYSTLQHH